MKSTLFMVALTLSLILVSGNLATNAFAQDDPSILVKIAKRAQDQIQNQITDKTPQEIKNLFEEGKGEFTALENSLSNNDLASAKEHFLSTMKIFTEVSRQIASNQTAPNEIKTTQPATINPTNELIRMKAYVNNLKNIAQKHNSLIDFSILDQLFITANNQIKDHQFNESTQTIQEIKQKIIEINTKLRQQASQQEQTRAELFAQKYLIQLDRLIDHAQATGQSQNIIQNLESAREDLVLANSPSEIITAVRNIMLIQQQFELSENKLLDLRISQIENIITNLSKSDQIDSESLQEFNQTIQNIKVLTSKSEFEAASELITSLTILVNQIQNYK